MKINTGRMVFLLAFLPTVANELTKYVAGTYDDLTTRKLIAAFILGVIFASVNGLMALRALYTDPANSTDKTSP